MAQSPFDLEAIRRNWARSIAPPKGHLPPRLQSVEPPRDVPADVRALVERIRELTLKRYSQQAETLAPFFSEAARLAERLADPGAAAEETTAHQLLALLVELEDLLDAFATIPR